MPSRQQVSLVVATAAVTFSSTVEWLCESDSAVCARHSSLSSPVSLQHRKPLRRNNTVCSVAVNLSLDAIIRLCYCDSFYSPSPPHSAPLNPLLLQALVTFLTSSQFLLGGWCTFDISCRCVFVTSAANTGKKNDKIIFHVYIRIHDTW